MKLLKIWTFSWKAQIFSSIFPKATPKKIGLFPSNFWTANEFFLDNNLIVSTRNSKFQTFFLNSQTPPPQLSDDTPESLDGFPSFVYLFLILSNADPETIRPYSTKNQTVVVSTIDIIRKVSDFCQIFGRFSEKCYTLRFFNSDVVPKILDVFLQIPDSFSSKFPNTNLKKTGTNSSTVQIVIVRFF